MDRPTRCSIRPLPLIPLLPFTQTGCKGCKDRDPGDTLEVTAGQHTIAGTFDAGSEAPTTPGPWTFGVAPGLVQAPAANLRIYLDDVRDR